VQNVEKPR